MPLIAGMCKSKGRIISDTLPKKAGVKDCSIAAQSIGLFGCSAFGSDLTSGNFFEITEISLISVGAIVNPFSLFKLTALLK